MLYRPASLDGNITFEVRHGNVLGLWQTSRPISPTVQPTECRVTSFMEHALATYNSMFKLLLRTSADKTEAR